MRIVLAFILAFGLLSCNNSKVRKDQKFSVLKGKYDGYKYEIAYDDSADLKPAIHQLFSLYTKLLNADSNFSLLYAFNNGKTLNAEQEQLYLISLNILQKVDSLCLKTNKNTSGHFNSGMHKLLQVWGFTSGSIHPELVRDSQIDSLRKAANVVPLKFDHGIPVKSSEGTTLNYQVVLKGLMADAIANMFDSVYHIKNYYVNLGGDIRAKGNNGNSSYWPISIEKPMFNTLKSIEFCKLPLKNYSLATENSYKNFFFYKGKRFSQNINPLTGYPARNELLSATILAKSAAEAKAYATACMTMGLEKSLAFISQHPELKAFLIFEKDQQIQYWATSNLAVELSKQE